MFQAIASRTANYIYHMLSVAKCGYDNAYGAAARPFHRQADVERLFEFRKHIMVNGGEHCGELYGLCVATPACFEEDADMLFYFEAIQDLFSRGVLQQNFSEFSVIYQKAFGDMWGIEITLPSLAEFYQSCLPLKTELLEIVRIFREKYSVYVDRFWEDTRSQLERVCEALNARFQNTRYMEQWEAMLHTRYQYRDFYLVLCNSIQDGPQAIDIAAQKDIFALPQDPETFAALASHEFGIYLLKELLADTGAFHHHHYYHQVEALAEFYNRKICGGYTCFAWDEDALRQYQALYEENPQITAKEMFLAVTGREK